MSRTYFLKVRGGQTVRFQTIAAMVSSLYHPEPPLEAIRLASWGNMLGFETLRLQNRSAWADLWKGRVKVTGGADAQRVLNAAFFYLHSSLHASTLTGMPPFGLSQFSYYYGHSFWDIETWSLLNRRLQIRATRVFHWFGEAAEAATAAFIGEKRRALGLFHQAWKNVWLEPFGMIRETPSQDYGCFLTNFGSLLQTAMFGFTGLRISEDDWRKYPKSLPAGWSKIEIDRVYVKGQAKRLVSTDGALAQFLDS